MWRRGDSVRVIGHIKADLAPVGGIVNRLGVTARGDVQRFHTANTLRRIQRYLPYRTGATIKLMIARSPVDEPFIHVDAPYARMLYYGRVMVDPGTGAAGFLTANGWRSRKGVRKVAGNRDIQYDKTKNPRAGPFWDKALMAAEGKQMAAELQDYVNRRGRR